jgi:TolB protein
MSQVNQAIQCRVSSQDELGGIMLKRLLLGIIVCLLCFTFGLQPYRGAAQSSCAYAETTPTSEPPVQGGRIAFIAGSKTYNTLKVVNADGSGLTTLVDEGDGSVMSAPQWSHNSKSIVFTIADAPNSSGQQGQDIEVFGNGCGGSLLNRTTYNANPAWSPDDRSIVFISDAFGQPHNNNSDLYTMNVDGSQLRRLTWPDPFANYVMWPQWSPNGRQIAFLDRVGCGARWSL